MKPERKRRPAARDRAPAEDTVRLGVSACLLGTPVRFDGGHKRDPFLTDTLGRFVEWVPVCPEDEAGYGTPREAMRLVRAGDSIRLLTVRSKVDLTESMEAYARDRVAGLQRLDLDGYVLKKDSPSCGLERVKVYAEPAPAVRDGRGLFAEELVRAMPLLPVEEEGRLHDPRLRENFVERVFAYRRLRALLALPPKMADLVRFHTRHKLLLLAHSPPAYAELGRLVASGGKADARRVAREYGPAFMEALSVMPSRGRHGNVLRHMAGYFRSVEDEASRRDLASAISDYQAGLVPLVVPVTLVAHMARRHQVAYLLDQVYLQPHPKELMLRNHA